jgi:glycosyltransferase involved in cell wall biosynthesis
MKVTVVIPTYNTEPVLLNKTILSILAQTHQDFDFIIVDDGSTNAGTLAFLLRIARAYNGREKRLIRVEFLPSLNIGLVFTPYIRIK